MVSPNSPLATLDHALSVPCLGWGSRRQGIRLIRGFRCLRDCRRRQKNWPVQCPFPSHATPQVLVFPFHTEVVERSPLCRYPLDVAAGLQTGSARSTLRPEG